MQGKIIDYDTGYVHIGYFNSMKKYISDSCQLKNGNLQFKGLINEPTIASFYKNSRRIDDPNWTEIFLEPNEMTITCKLGEFKKAKITGSNAQTEFGFYNAQIDSLNNKWKDVLNKLNTAKAIGDTITVNEIRNNRLPFYKNEANSITRHFISRFPASSVSAYLLGAQTEQLGLDSLKIYYSKLIPPIQKSFYGQSINDFIIKSEQLQIGMPAPEFKQVDITGNEISLKSFRGKYVLLEFWASWCVPCREENSFLKKAYSKYHDKGLTIISYSLDKLDEKNDWVKAIKKPPFKPIQAF